MSSKINDLSIELNLLKKLIENTEGESVIGDEYIILGADDLSEIMQSCSALLETLGVDLDTREILGG